MRLRLFLILFLLISLTNVGIAIFMEYEKARVESLPLDADGGCFLDGGCATVASSSYSQIMGIPLTYLGIVTFSSLAIIFALLIFAESNPSLNSFFKKIQFQFILLLALLAGSLFAIYFMYLQFFVIKAICQFCIVIDSLAIILALLFFYVWRTHYER